MQDGTALHDDVLLLATFQLDFLLDVLQHFSIRMMNDVRQLQRGGSSGIVFYLTTDRKCTLFMRYLWHMDKDSFGTISCHIQMLLGHNHQPHIPIDAAKESEVGRNGSNVLTGIVHFYSEPVFSGVQIGGKVECESGIASGVSAYFLAVQIDGGCLAGSIYFKKHLLVLPCFRDMERPSVPAYTFIIILFGIGIGIPCMRQMNVRPPAVIKVRIGSFVTFLLQELPTVVDGKGFPLRTGRVGEEKESNKAYSHKQGTTGIMEMTGCFHGIRG